MKLVEFFRFLRERDIVLSVENGRLRCTAPKGVLTAEIQERIKADRDDLIGFLTQTSPAAALRSPLDQRASFPLSFSQQRLWFLDQVAHSGAAYHIPSSTLLQGELSIEDFHKSVDGVLNRHDILRSRFPLEKGVPVQKIGPKTHFRLPLIDLTRLPEADRRAEQDHLLKWEAAAPFQITRGPLLRLALVRLRQRRHLLLATLHHLVADGWSKGVLLEDLARFYGFFTGVRQRRPEPLSHQYADFVIWQKQRLQSRANEESLTYWTRRLAGLPPDTPLPYSRMPQGEARFQGAHLRVEWDDAVTRRIGDLSRRLETTLFMTLMTAFQTLLYRYSGRRRIPVGTPLAGRPRVEWERLIGCFVNTVVLWADLEPGLSFHDLAGRIKSATLDAFQHGEVPFEHLVAALNPDRQTNRNPFFEAVLVLQNTPWAQTNLPGLSLTPVTVPHGTAKFDLVFTISRLSDGLQLEIEYNRAVFDGPLIAQMADFFLHILTTAADQPQQRILRLPLGPIKNQPLVLPKSFSPTITTTIHQRFEEGARRWPDAVALGSEGRHLSYGLLNRASDEIARRLRNSGVGLETAVGLLGDNPWELIPAMLAILKAGAAYVPLYPETPRRRLALILTETGARHLLCPPHLRQLVPLPAEGILDLEEPRFMERSMAAPQHRPRVDPSNAAYIIYTSGSSGTPKGAILTHGSLMALFAGSAGHFRFDQNDIWTLFHSHSFDFSVWETWGALLHGGRLVITAAETKRDGAAFRNLLMRERVSVLNQTPTVFRELFPPEAESHWQRNALRYVIFGGEALSPQNLTVYLSGEQTESTRWFNMYGITETCVHVTIKALTASDLRPGPASPIGAPLAHLSATPLGPEMAPVPLGGTGELHIGGLGLARAYVGLPALTAQVFVPDPFSSLPGARLYRSGDGAQRLINGTLNYMGRLDGQIKIRGFRVELNEISTALRAFPGISQAVTLYRTPAEGRPLLIGYFVSQKKPHPQPSKLRSFLAEHLPEYMVPQSFECLERLPVNANGKLDLAALPVPQPERDRPEEPPRTHTEEVLCAIMAEVLRLSKVGADRNFFHLGGHSLILTQLVSRAREFFRVEIPLEAVFKAPTPRQMALLIERLRVENERKELLALLDEVEALPEEELERRLAETRVDST